MKRTFKYIAMMLTLAMLLMVTGCSTTGSTENTPTPTPVATPTPAATGNIVNDDLYKNVVNITIEMENGDVMKAELYPDVAPISVANFTKLIDEKFFDGLIFHRVIKGFMIQGGGFDTEFNHKETASIKGEFKANGVTNELRHTRGVLSMARTNAPDSASSQFFIMHEDSLYLDNQYAAFGKVTEGLDIVDKIANTETEDLSPMFEDCPRVPQIIKTITIDK